MLCGVGSRVETAKQDKENHVLFGLGESVVLFNCRTYDTYNIHFYRLLLTKVLSQRIMYLLNAHKIKNMAYHIIYKIRYITR